MGKVSKILKWTAIGAGGFVVIAVAASLAFGKPGYKSPETLQQENKQPDSPVVVTPSTTPIYAAASNQNEKAGNDIVSVGATAYLRIPHNSDPESVVLLSPTADSYGEIQKAYSVKNDPQALFGALGELAAKGFIGVSNGTEIVVVDKKGILDPLYQVVIKKGVRDVDADKLGKSGWIDRTFISKD